MTRGLKDEDNRGSAKNPASVWNIASEEWGFHVSMCAMNGKPVAKSTQRRKVLSKKAHSHSHSERAETLLRTQGLKVTECRLLVLRSLLDRHKPSTAQELLEDLSPHGLDQVTVYRTLTTLVENQIAQQVSTIDGSRRFEVHACEGCRVDHPHLQCRACGALECLEQRVLPTLMIPTQVGGYAIDEARLYLLGRCPKCQKGKASRSRTLAGEDS